MSMSISYQCFVQASPSPGSLAQCDHPVVSSPSPSHSALGSASARRTSALLHPDHARLLLLHRPSSPDHASEDDFGPQSGSSSTASSMNRYRVDFRRIHLNAMSQTYVACRVNHSLTERVVAERFVVSVTVFGF